LCKEHCNERQARRKQIHQEDDAFNRQQFASVFSLELIQVVSSAVEVDSSQITSSFVHLYKKEGVPLPEGLTQFPHTPIDVNDRPPVDIQEVVKSNFDAIGMKLISMENYRELLIALGEALAGLERLSS